MRFRREVSAGGVVARSAERGWEVLLASRRTRRGELAWGLPKGFIEEGEPMEETAVREVREETGWEATVRESLGQIGYRYSWGDELVDKVVHFFLMNAGTEVGGRDTEMEEVAWFPLKEAIEMASYKGEREVIERAARSLEAPIE